MIHLIKIVSLSDINNYKDEDDDVIIIDNIVDNNVKFDNSKPIVYIYNTHDTEKNIVYLL
ncbi:MAG: hypothetical protein L6V81_01765 [Clostridium sp.]|nr:MAG: hypothetical protein L6V81_01765 [Clostridium sp.]